MAVINGELKELWGKECCKGNPWWKAEFVINDVLRQFGLYDTNKQPGCWVTDKHVFLSDYDGLDFPVLAYDVDFEAKHRYGIDGPYDGIIRSAKATALVPNRLPLRYWHEYLSRQNTKAELISVRKSIDKVGEQLNQLHDREQNLVNKYRNFLPNR